MIALTLRLELRRSRALTLWLSVVVLAYSGIIGAMYPIFVNNASAIEASMKVYPKEMLAAFGMTGSLADPGVLFGTYVGSFLWPVVAAMAAIVLATRPVAADVDRGWADLPLGTPMTRSRYLAAAILGQVVVLGVLALATVAGLYVAGRIVGAGFDGTRFLEGGAILWLFACAIAGVTSLVGAVTLSRGMAAGLSAGALLVMYLLNIVAQVQRDLAWLADFGAFKYLSVTDLIDTGAVPWASVGVFATVAIAGWAAALVVFRRRDLLA